MVMRQQKLLKTARRPVIHQMRNARVQQRHCVVEFDRRAARATAMRLLQPRSTARRAVAAKDRHQLRATRSRQRNRQTHSASLQRFGESIVALGISFANIKTVGIDALHACGKLRHLRAHFSRFILGPG